MSMILDDNEFDEFTLLYYDIIHLGRGSIVRCYLCAVTCSSIPIVASKLSTMLCSQVLTGAKYD